LSLVLGLGATNFWVEVGDFLVEANISRVIRKDSGEEIVKVGISGDEAVDEENGFIGAVREEERFYLPKVACPELQD